MKLKKIIYLLLAFLPLFAGCELFPGLDLLKIKDGETSQVMITINGNARTILPTITDIYFSKIVANAEPAEGNLQDAPEPIENIPNEYGNINIYINIPYGNWIINVTLYVNIGGEEYPILKDSVPLFVNSNQHWVDFVFAAPESGEGTFTYNASFPVAGTATLNLSTLDGEPVIEDHNIENGVPTSETLDSGFYFLTVTATSNERTVIRNEIVHIYPYLQTDAVYIFPKTDFGDGPLRLSGTVNFLVDGVQPEQAWLYFQSNEWSWSGFPINFTGSNGDGTWEINLSNLYGASTIRFGVGLSWGLRVELSSIPVPVDDITDIDLGTARIDTTTLTEEEWFEGNMITDNTTGWYSIDAIAGKTYHIWFNDRWDGDGTKTSDIDANIYDRNGGYIVDYHRAWDHPISFTADYDGKFYIKVNTSFNEYFGTYFTGSYAIAYSTDIDWHNNSFQNATLLEANEWVDGYITVPYNEDWYSIDVKANETYFFRWNSSWEGDGTKSLDIDVTTFYLSNGTQIFQYDSAWYEPRSFTTSHDDTVYIRVRAYDGNSLTGTYGIMFYDKLPSVPKDVFILTETLTIENDDPDSTDGTGYLSGEELAKVLNAAPYSTFRVYVINYTDPYQSRNNWGIGEIGSIGFFGKNGVHFWVDVDVGEVLALTEEEDIFFDIFNECKIAMIELWEPGPDFVPPQPVVLEYSKDLFLNNSFPHSGSGTIEDESYNSILNAKSGSVVRLYIQNNSGEDRNNWGLGHFGTNGFITGKAGENFSVDIPIFEIIDNQINIWGNCEITNIELWEPED